MGGEEEEEGAGAGADDDVEGAGGGDDGLVARMFFSCRVACVFARRRTSRRPRRASRKTTCSTPAPAPKLKTPNHSALGGR